jgi:hypothetical protein
MHAVLPVKYPLFLSDFNETWILSTNIFINNGILNFIKIRPVVAGFFFMQTGKYDTATFAFRNSEKAPKTAKNVKIWKTYTYVLA